MKKSTFLKLLKDYPDDQDIMFKVVGTDDFYHSAKVVTKGEVVIEDQQYNEDTDDYDDLKTPKTTKRFKAQLELE